MPPDRNLFSHVLTSRTAQVKPVVTAAKAGDNHMIGESEQPIVCRLAIEPAAPLLDTPRCNCKTICCVSCVPDGVLQYCLVFMLGGTAQSWILHVVLRRRMVLLVDCHPGEHDSESHPVTTMASTSDMSSRETVLVFLPP